MNKPGDSLSTLAACAAGVFLLLSSAAQAHAQPSPDQAPPAAMAAQAPQPPAPPAPPPPPDGQMRRGPGRGRAMGLGGPGPNGGPGMRPDGPPPDMGMGRPGMQMGPQGPGGRGRGRRLDPQLRMRMRMRMRNMMRRWMFDRRGAGAMGGRGFTRPMGPDARGGGMGPRGGGPMGGGRGSMRGPGGGPMGGIGQQFRGLDLTPDQRTKFHGVVQQHRTELEAVQKRQQEARALIQQQAMGGTINEQAVRNATAAAAKAEADAILLRGKLQNELRGLLTPEQQQRLRDRTSGGPATPSAAAPAAKPPVKPAPPKPSVTK